MYNDGAPDIDLGDYPLGGGYEPKESVTPREWVNNHFQYKFKDYDALVTSSVFQKALSQALQKKDEEIGSLRRQLMQPC